MAAHRRCNGCHRTQNPKYPVTKKFARCDECHEPWREGYYIADADQFLSVMVETEGLLEKGRDLEAYFNAEYEDKGFELREEDEADLKVHVNFRVIEVFDGLLPPGSERGLYQGTCRITIRSNEEEILNGTIRSKVIGSDTSKSAVREIEHYLKEEALHVSFAAFSRTFDGE